MDEKLRLLNVVVSGARDYDGTKPNTEKVDNMQSVKLSSMVWYPQDSYRQFFKGNDQEYNQWLVNNKLTKADFQEKLLTTKQKFQDSIREYLTNFHSKLDTNFTAELLMVGQRSITGTEDTKYDSIVYDLSDLSDDEFKQVSKEFIDNYKSSSMFAFVDANEKTKKITTTLPNKCLFFDEKTKKVATSVGSRGDGKLRYGLNHIYNEVRGTNINMLTQTRELNSILNKNLTGEFEVFYSTPDFQKKYYQSDLTGNQSKNEEQAKGLLSSVSSERKNETNNNRGSLPPRSANTVVEEQNKYETKSSQVDIQGLFEDNNKSEDTPAPAETIEEPKEVKEETVSVENKKESTVTDAVLEKLKSNKDFLNFPISQLEKNSTAVFEILSASFENDVERQDKLKAQIDMYNKYVQTLNEKDGFNLPIYDTDNIGDNILALLNESIDDLRQIKVNQNDLQKKNKAQEESKVKEIKPLASEKVEPKQEEVVEENKESTPAPAEKVNASVEEKLIEKVNENLNDFFADKKNSINAEAQKELQKIKEAQDTLDQAKKTFFENVTTGGSSFRQALDKIAQEYRNNPYLLGAIDRAVTTEVLMIPLKDEELRRERAKSKDLSSTLKTSEQNIVTLENSLADSNSKVKELEATHTKDIEKLGAEIDKLLESKNVLEEENGLYEEQNKEYEEKLNTIKDTHKEELNSKNSIIEDLRNSNKKLQENLEKVKQDFETKIEQTNKAHKEEIESKNRMIADLQETIKLKDTMVNDYKSRNELLESNLKDLKEELEKVKSRNTELTREQELLKEQLEASKEIAKTVKQNSMIESANEKIESGIDFQKNQITYSQRTSKEAIKEKLATAIKTDPNSVESARLSLLSKGAISLDTLKEKVETKEDELNLAKIEKDFDELVKIGIVRKNQAEYTPVLKTKTLLFKNSDSALEDIKAEYDLFNKYKTNKETASVDGWIAKANGFENLSKHDQKIAKESYEDWASDRKKENKDVFSLEEYVNYVQTKYQEQKAETKEENKDQEKAQSKFKRNRNK
jgi:hypothetical protein